MSPGPCLSFGEQVIHVPDPAVVHSDADTVVHLDANPVVVLLAEDRSPWGPHAVPPPGYP